MLNVTILNPNIMSQFSRADHRICNEMHASIDYLGGMWTAPRKKVPELKSVTMMAALFNNTHWTSSDALQYLTIEIANNCANILSNCARGLDKQFWSHLRVGVGIGEDLGISRNIPAFTESGVGGAFEKGAFVNSSFPKSLMQAVLPF